MSTPEFEFDVPATTAHLGPGYGVLGLALDLTFHVSVRRSEVDGIVVERAGEGAVGATLGLRHDAVLRGVRAASERFAIDVPAGLSIHIEGVDVPRGTGLGTNSADFASGAGVALRFADASQPSADEVLSLLVELGCDPGHGAAAICGGLALAIPAKPTANSDRLRFHLLTPAIDASWRFIIVAPEHAITTADVHRIVPASLPHAIVPRTSARLAGLLHALATANEELASDCLIDESHVPYRLDIAPGMRDAIAAAQAAGAAGATISGHGPAILALTTDPDRAETIRDAMHAAFEAVGVEATARICETASRGGALVTDANPATD